MNLTDLLENLSAKNVELWVDRDKLRYRAPEKLLSPELLAEIKQYKPEIIRILSQGNDLEATYPLSHGQKALWFLYQLAPDSVAYNITLAVKLVTNLDILALKQACQVLVARHPVLRTTFTTIDGEPVQTVHKKQQVDFSVEDAFALSQDDINNWLLQTSARPFNLEVGPILRFNLLINHNKTKEHIFLITQHHILTDFWSGEIILGELRLLYEAIILDTEPLLLEQNIQYRDYVKSSEQMLSGWEGERLWNYWQQQLSGELPVLSLPTDRPRLESQTYNGASLGFNVSEKLLQKLTELAKRERASLYMVLLTALQILLGRYTNLEDILIGSPMMNRSRPEFEKIVGYFTNPVVLRADLSGNPTFQELLGRSRLCVLDALEHQDYPFPLLVERLQPVRDPSISPLYQVAFAWDRAHQGDQEVSLTDSDEFFVESISIGTKGAAFDLTLTILHASDSLKGTWNYNTDLFDSSTIERMSQHYVTLLEAIVANPTENLAQLPLLTISEKQQLLVEWNDTTVDYPFDKCIHHLFEEQVALTPDAVAVVFEDQQLTYGELNAKANQLAHYLQSLGVGTDVLVGICVERSLDMVVGLLAILKAGGAYVPLDPAYPQERLSYMLTDSGVEVLLTQQQLIFSLPKHEAVVICLDTDWHQIAKHQEKNLITDVSSNNLVYIIYTSGSTGKPKGAGVYHRGFLNLVNWLIRDFQFTSKDSTVLISSLSFDLTQKNIFAPLIIGGILHLLPPGFDPIYILDVISKQRVSWVNCTPSTFYSLLTSSNDSFAKTQSLRYVFLGGEPISIPSLLSWLNSPYCSAKIVNSYGPTECADVCSAYIVKQPHEFLNKPIPIGKPIPNVKLYILDQNLQLVPSGVIGELCIAGVGVGMGYINDFERTNEKFIPNPFSSDTQSERLYKTGDLTRYLSDGNIEYIGRIDNQVKIRGFRIELGEIEAVLNAHPQIQQAVVIATEDIPGNRRLVAYLIPSDLSLLTNQLREFLKHKLPEYMLPSAIVFLESFPLTPSGKVDRRALRAPEPSHELSDKFVAPLTPTEEILSHIWAQVLKVEHVGIHDNFFSLGGHSLLATQVISRIRNIFQFELPLRSLFAEATVAQLAQSIEQLQQQNLQLSVPPILARAQNAELPLSFAQQRLWFLDQLQPLSASYNIPMALRLVGNLNVAALKQSLREIIHRHSALRTNLITVDGKAAQIIQDSTNWTVTIVDLQDFPLKEQEIAAHELTQLQAIQPFNLSSDALVRATLVLLSETEHVLNVCMHHIVSDGWSIAVFLEELAALYNAYSSGKASPLVPLPIQYADFAIWQRQWLGGVVLQSQLSYWEKQLANAPTFLPLPTDRPRGAVQTFAGAYYEFSLSVELTQKLTKLSTERGVTLFMTLLAGFNTLLYRYTGQTDILVGSPIANRHHRELEPLIGFFVNTLVMRTDFSGNPSFTELLLRVRSMALDAYAHQDLPLEILVEALQPERDLSHTPLFQVMFALQNAPISEVELSGLSVSSLPIETATAKFDLTLSMENTHTGLFGEWEYNTNLFDSSTIERMASHFVRLLEAIVANPTERISALALMRASESQQLLVEWNDTTVDYPFDKCIHHLFEEQVELTPESVALVYENQQLTYGELNCRANRLAHYLQSLGVSADVLVGICVERSLDMVVGLLGILKAGGAYVPLDPEYPTDRLSFMLSDAQVSVLLTQQHLVEKLPEHKAHLVYLDTDHPELVQTKEISHADKVKPSNLAYVLYTSGSTGRPKAVAIEHHSPVALVSWAQSVFTPIELAGVLASTSICFDLSVFELFVTLSVGGKVIIAQNALHLSSMIARSQVTLINTVPSALAELIREQDLPPLVCTVNLAGEALQNQLVQQIYQHSKAERVFNLYGPSEDTTYSTYSLIEKGASSSPTIGRPIANTQIYILDQYLQPVPVGVPGELHISGAGLARGYLNRLDLTEEKFIDNPFKRSRGEGALLGKGGERLYKTGDKARYLSSGNIEYLGRIDLQVKIRGFRIELGEIEAVLSQHKDVQISCVIAREETRGNKLLVAYVMPHPQVTLTTAELRSFLSNKLPGYMVPNVFVILESLPLTPNGKVDRRALPNPDLHQELSDYVMPNTETEKIIAGIWQKALSVEKVGIYNNFFELGGHSLLLLGINQQLQEIFGLNIPIVDMFKYSSIHKLSEWLKNKRKQEETVKEHNERHQSYSESKKLKNKQLQSRQQYRSQKKK